MGRDGRARASRLSAVLRAISRVWLCVVCACCPTALDPNSSKQPPFPVWENFSPCVQTSIMSARSAKPSLKKARISAESSKTSKKAALAPEARAQTKDVPTLSVKSKGKERAASPVPGPRKQGKTATKTSDPSSSTSLPTSFKVVCGSYEKLLYGLEGTVSTSSSDHSFHLRPIFIFPAHVSCIKSVAASPQGGKWLATGSADEIIKVWDLRRRKEIGGLMQHQGTYRILYAHRLHAYPGT